MIEFLQNLWRGGTYGYIQEALGDKHIKSHWLDPENIQRVWDNPNRDWRMGVNPSLAIPTHNIRGEQKPPSMVGARNSLIECVNALYCDLDGDDDQLIETMVFMPSVIISSGGGAHCYWFLRDTVRIVDDDDRATMAKLQRDWAAFVGQSDKGAVDLRRTLRIEGTYNQKYRPARPVEFVQYDLGLRYDVSDLYNASYRTPKVFVYSGKVSGDVDGHVKAYLRKSRRDVNNYADWIAIGAYIKGYYPGADGIEAWKAVSMQSPKYKQGDCEKRWEGLGNV